MLIILVTQLEFFQQNKRTKGDALIFQTPEKYAPAAATTASVRQPEAAIVP